MLSRGGNRNHFDQMAEYEAAPLTQLLPGLYEMIDAHVAAGGENRIKVVLDEQQFFYQVLADPPWVMPILSEYIWYCMSGLKKNYWRNEFFKKKMSDGLGSVYQPQWGRFPSGLLNEFLEETKLEERFGIEVLVAAMPEENLVARCPDPEANLLKPEEWQVNATNALLAARRGLLGAPVNFGKTEVAFNVIAKRRVPTIIVAPLKSIVTDAFGSIQKRFPRWKCVYINSDTAIVEDARGVRGTFVTVAQILNADVIASTPVKLRNFLHKYPQYAKRIRARFRQMFVDEAHVAVRDIHKEILNFVRPYFLYGMTGTFRSHEWVLETYEILGRYGPVLYEDDTMAMVERGVSADFTVEFHSPAAVKPPIKRASNGRLVRQWRKKEDHSAEEDIKKSLTENDDMMNYLVDDIANEVKNGNQVMVICTRKAFWSALTGHLRARHKYVKVEAMWGGTHSKTRMENIGRFKTGDVEVFIVMNIFDMGVNLPSIDVLWLPQPVNVDSWKRLVQRIGRSLRKKVRSKTSIETVAVRLFSFEHTERYFKNHVEVRKLMTDSMGYKVVDVGQLTGVVEQDSEDEAVLEAYRRFAVR